MIDEDKEELASLYALGSLSTGEVADCEKAMRDDGELRALVHEFEETAAALAYAAPAREPSPRVLSELLRVITAEKTGTALPAPVERSAAAWLPWSLAAGFALMTTFFAFERSSLQKQVSSLRERDSLASLQIASLTSQVENAPRSVGAIAWDERSQRGAVSVANLPVPDAQQDYQLWVIDPKYPDPVDGGIVKVGEDGTGRGTFRAGRPIGSAKKFAISRERKGGAPKTEGIAPKPEGPIVMLSD